MPFSQIEPVMRVYKSIPPALFAELRRVVGDVLHDMAAALPTKTVVPVPPPPSTQLLVPVAAAVAAIRERVNASPDARCETAIFLQQQLEKKLPDSAMDSDDEGKAGGLAMSGKWDDAHTATDSILSVWLRAKPVERAAAPTPAQQRIDELLRVEDDNASDGSGAAFARSEELLALLADELHDVPTLCARARVLSLLLNLDGLCVALEDLRQCIGAYTSMLPGGVTAPCAGLEEVSAKNSSSEPSSV